MGNLTKKQRREFSNYRFKPFSATLLCVVVCLFLINLTIAALGDYEGSSDINDGNTVGVFVIDNKTYTAAWSSGDIRTYWVNGTYISFCSHGVSNAGMTTNGSFVWVAIQGDDDIRQFTDLECGGGETIDLDNANADTRGMHYYDGMLYITDAVDDKVYKHWASNKSLVGSFGLNALNTNPYGITGDTTNLYITDTTDKVIYKYLLDGTYVGIAFEATGATVPYGIDINDTTFFVTADSATLYRYEYYIPPILSGMTTTLTSPSNDTLISDVGYNFSANYTAYNLNLQNVTYYVWFTNRTTFNVTTFTIDPAVSNSSSEYIDNFVLGDYLWNVKATADNSTGTFSKWATNNRSFEVVPFSKSSESWVNPTIEGSTDLFSVNLFLLTGNRISDIRFYYDGTSYATSFSEPATNVVIATRTHNIPAVSTDSNFTFYWNVTLETGQSIASETENQTVQDLSLDNCTSGYVLFNFSMVDEDSQKFLIGATENTRLKIELVLSTLTNGFLGLNISRDFNLTNPAAICFNVDIADSEYRADATIEYKADNKFVEYYNIQNYVLTNLTDYQNITLYNLNSSTGTEFRITYKDSNFNLVPGAVIQIQRKYIDEGVFKTVEIPLISSAGYTIAHLIRNDAIYNLVVLKNGVVLDSFTNIVADCQNPTLSQCVININSFSSAVSPESFSSTGTFSSTLTYNATTRVVTSVFVISSGVPSMTTLNVTLIDGTGSLIVCADQLNAAGGTLTCTVPDTFGNSTVIAQVWNNGNLKMQRTISLGEDASQIYGSSLIFISLTIMLLIIGMSITDNPMILGIMLVFGIIILTVLNMINSFGWIGPGATILWLVVAIIIILIKGSNRQ